jgi:aspartate 1-decarboxylase
MLRTLLSGKIHRATVTDSDLNYIGSIGIDLDLMDAAGIRVDEQVAVVDINNGARFETYTVAAPRGSGDIVINGAAARLVHRGDLVIIFCYAAYEPHELAAHTPRIVHVDDRNRIVSPPNGLAAEAGAQLTAS